MNYIYSPLLSGCYVYRKSTRALPRYNEKLSQDTLKYGHLEEQNMSTPKYN